MREQIHNNILFLLKLNLLKKIIIFTTEIYDDIINNIIYSYQN